MVAPSPQAASDAEDLCAGVATALLLTSDASLSWPDPEDDGFSCDEPSVIRERCVVSISSNAEVKFSSMSVLLLLLAILLAGPPSFANADPIPSDLSFLVLELDGAFCLAEFSSDPEDGGSAVRVAPAAGVSTRCSVAAVLLFALLLPVLPLQLPLTLPSVCVAGVRPSLELTVIVIVLPRA